MRPSPSLSEREHRLRTTTQGLPVSPRQAPRGRSSWRRGGSCETKEKNCSCSVEGLLHRDCVACHREHSCALLRVLLAPFPPLHPDHTLPTQLVPGQPVCAAGAMIRGTEVVSPAMSRTGSEPRAPTPGRAHSQDEIYYGRGLSLYSPTSPRSPQSRGGGSSVFTSSPRSQQSREVRARGSRVCERREHLLTVSIDMTPHLTRQGNYPPTNMCFICKVGWQSLSPRIHTPRACPLKHSPKPPPEGRAARADALRLRLRLPPHIGGGWVAGTIAPVSTRLDSCLLCQWWC